MARAQALYPATICHYVWMRNHFHMIINVEDPEVVERFIGRIKTESAHAINRLLGRRRRTICVGDYDAVTILAFDDGLDKIRYLYGNQQAAETTVTIENYLRPNSWNALITEVRTTNALWIQRTALSPELVDHPHAWMKVFNVTDPEEHKRINAKIIMQVLANEVELRNRSPAASPQTPTK